MYKAVVDLCGSLPTSIDGIKHLQVIFDVTFNYTVAVTLNTRSEALQTLMDVLTRRKLLTGRPKLRFHTDNSLDLTSAPV